MNFKILLANVGLLACAVFAVRGQDDQRKNAERYIKESESHWAEAGMKGDTSAIERILADDFLGVAPDGSLYDKKKEIADTRDDKGRIQSNHVNDVKVRFFGDTAVAQGSETWERVSGTPKRGTYVWTDTWVRRNDKWQIVAAEDVTRPIAK